MIEYTTTPGSPSGSTLPVACVFYTGGSRTLLPLVRSRQREVPSTVKLSVKANDLLGSDVEDTDMVRRAADAGADAIGYWPWSAERPGDVVDTAASEGGRRRVPLGRESTTHGAGVPPDRPHGS